MASLVGKTLKNRYRVDDLLGRGGMAEVYKVYDLQRGVWLAMKVLREDLAEDRVFLRRFQREAQNLAKLQHPNIVRFYGLEQEDRLAFILMEYIDGTTLRGKIFDAHGPLTDQEVLDVMEPVCSALNYAHQMGIVHCDLKSANIMLDKAGKVYLTDFGIARMMDMSTSTMTGIGTPAYMAPELIIGGDPTPQTDIYALGVLLYEMYSGGERPFTGEHADTTGTTAEKMRWEHLHLKAPSLLNVNSKASVVIDEIIQKCLAKKEKGRYQNILQLQAAIAASISRPVDGAQIEENYHPEENKRGKLRDDGGVIDHESDQLIVMKKAVKNRANTKTKILLSFFICLSLLLVFIIYQLVKDDYRIAIVKNNETTEETKLEEYTAEPTEAMEQAVETALLTQTSEETETCINEAELVSETYKDGYSLKSRVPFIKSWVVKNIGTCVWNSNYKLVFESGSQMNGPDSINFLETIEPGEEIELKLNLTSPDEIGFVIGNWSISTDKGDSFYKLFVIIDTTSHYNSNSRDLND